MKIAKDMVVEMHYTLTDPAGEVIDTSREDGGEPLAFLCGYQNIIPGLENALMGLEKGAKLVVNVEPADGYGVYDETLTHTVERSAVELEEDLETGMGLVMMTQHGPIEVVVKDFNDETVTLDLNHPLAGMALNFDVEIMNVRSASEEELSHGHVHQHGHHHH